LAVKPAPIRSETSMNTIGKAIVSVTSTVTQFFATSRPTYTVICARGRRARDDRALSPPLSHDHHPRCDRGSTTLRSALPRSRHVGGVVCILVCGLPLTSEQLALYTKYTGRTTPPTTPLHEAWAGRRRRSRVEAARLRAAGQKLGIALGQSRGRSVHAAGSLCLDR
jgi:hypothetical protein